MKSLQAPRRVRADLEALSADVREHRHRHRQRARRAIGAVGALSGLAVRRLFIADADARPADAGTSRVRREPRRRVATVYCHC